MFNSRRTNPYDAFGTVAPVSQGGPHFTPIDLCLDASQYGKRCGVFMLVPSDQHVTDYRLAYELGLLHATPLLREATQRIVMVLSNIPLLVLAMHAWRLKHPDALIVLRIYTTVPTSFLQPSEKMVLPAALGPLCVIGRGRSSGVPSIFGESAPMLTTLHIDCSFNDIPFARHMDSPQNGFYVSGVGFAHSTSEVVWQVAAGGVLAFTVAVICGPLVAGLAGFGVALGALSIPAGTTLKYVASIAAARIGAWLAGRWTNLPQLVEGFSVPNQHAPRMIMASELYGGQTRQPPSGCCDGPCRHDFHEDDSDEQTDIMSSDSDSLLCPCGPGVPLPGQYNPEPNDVPEEPKREKGQEEDDIAQPPIYVPWDDLDPEPMPDLDPEPMPEPVVEKKRAAVAEKWSKMVDKLKIKRNAGKAKDRVTEQVDLIC